MLNVSGTMVNATLRESGLSPVRESRLSGLEALSCPLRVIIHALQGFARACKLRISKPVSLLCLALCCTVLRSRWCERWCQTVRLLLLIGRELLRSFSEGLHSENTPSKRLGQPALR